MVLVSVRNLIAESNNQLAGVLEWRTKYILDLSLLSNGTIYVVWMHPIPISK